jgi:hypothetical protein
LLLNEADGYARRAHRCRPGLSSRTRRAPADDVNYGARQDH